MCVCVSLFIYTHMYSHIYHIEENGFIFEFDVWIFEIPYMLFLYHSSVFTQHPCPQSEDNKDVLISSAGSDSTMGHLLS